MHLKQRQQINILLLATIAALLLLIILSYDEPNPVSGQEHITSLQKESITSIKVHRNGLPDIALEKRGERWFMSQPYSVLANQFQVDSLLQLASSQSHAVYALETINLKKYQLDEPILSVIFNDNIKIDFGTTEPTQNRRYIAIDRQMHIIEDHYSQTLMSPPATLINHILLSNKNITRLVLPDFSVELKDKQWIMQPAAKGYTQDQILELIDIWQNTKANSITPYQRKPKGKAIEVYIDHLSQPVVFYPLITPNEFALIRADLKLKYSLPLEFKFYLTELPPKLDIPEDVNL